MRFLDAYIYLLKTRFDEKFEVKIDVPDEQREKLVVPLSLQMLFENAIKHNVVSADKPLQIRVYVEEGEILVVRNNLQMKARKPVGTETGLSNLKNRYRLLGDKIVEAFSASGEFVVRIPLLVAS